MRTIVAPLAVDVRAELEGLPRRLRPIAQRYIKRLRLEPDLGAPAGRGLLADHRCRRVYFDASSKPDDLFGASAVRASARGSRRQRGAEVADRVLGPRGAERRRAADRDPGRGRGASRARAAQRVRAGRDAAAQNRRKEVSMTACVVSSGRTIEP